MYLKLKSYRFFFYLNFFFTYIYNFKYFRIFSNYLYKIYDEKNFTNDKSKILVELNFLHSSLIINSFLLKKILERNKSEIVLYRTFYSNNFFIKILLKFFYFFKIDIFLIYRRVFNLKKIIYPVIDKNSYKLNTLFIEVCSKLKSKKDVENIKIKDIYIGDLIYDSYLRIYNEPTIIFDKKFYKFLRKSLSYFIFWENYLNRNKVKAVIISHSVYISAILLRIAVKKNIPVYISTLSNIYKLSEKNFFPFEEFKKYPITFSKLKKNEKQKAINLSKKRLLLRFRGKVGVDMHYSTKSSYTNNFKTRLIKNSHKIKILIATHCFFDSPHSYGKNLFCDFYEWLEYLGKLSIKTDYDWYIKLHPDYHPLTLKVINGFLKRYSKFNLLPSDSSHHQIINEGINFVLTVYGSIGHEYPLFNVPVINASINNPHIKYSFNIHPKNISHYKKIILNLKNIKYKINKKKVYEYYYMAFLYKTEKESLIKINQVLKYVGGYHNQFTSKIYKYWILHYKKNILLEKKIEKFINNKRSYSLYI